MRIALFICFHFIFLTVFGQERQISSTFQKLVEGDENWTDYSFAGRLGYGIQAYQKMPYVEIGISRGRFYWEGTRFGSMSQYVSLEIWSRSLDSEIYGNQRPLALKIGWDGVRGTNQTPFAYGLEIKYLSDFRYFDVLLTPKIGTGMIGFMYCFYSYNFSLNNHAVHHIGGHQISFVWNMNRFILTGKRRNSKTENN